MAKRSREILALILLFVLVFAGLVAIIAYLTVGHNWNVAATNIDDSVGSMSGYTVFVYKGQMEDDELDVEDIESSSVGSSKSSSSSSSKDSDAVTFSELIESYRDKDAAVIELDTDHPEMYEEPLILSRNGTRIAVFSVSDKTTAIGLDKTMSYLKSLSIDYAVVISTTTPTEDEEEDADSAASTKSSSSSSSSSSATSSDSSASKATVVTFNDYLLSMSGIDVVIDLSRDKYSTSGQNASGKFLVSSPVKGYAGLLLVSPSNVVSAKTVELAKS